MNRSMMVSVGVLVVLGVIVAVNILSNDDSGPTAGDAGGSNLPALDQAGRSPVRRAASPQGEAGSIPVIPPGQSPERRPGDGPAGAAESVKMTTQDNSPAVTATTQAALATCSERIARGEVGPALRELGHSYRASADRAARDGWRESLLAWSQEFLRAPSDRSGMFDRYQIRSGDVLIRIAAAQAKARKIHLDHRFIQMLNRIGNPSAIRIGQKIWLPNVDVSAVVTLGERRLDVFLGDCLLCSYPVGIGKDNKTPLARFTVGEKTWHPTWYFNGREIPYGHPDNELGEAWIGLDHPELERFGIHGTDDESTIGKAVSRGCVRLKNADVTELFQIIPKGAEVVIRP